MVMGCSNKDEKTNSETAKISQDTSDTAHEASAPPALTQTMEGSMVVATVNDKEITRQVVDQAQASFELPDDM